jgi:YggT family protein
MTGRRGPTRNVQKNARPPKRPGKFQVRVGMDQMIRSADAVLGQDRPTSEPWTIHRYLNVKHFTPDVGRSLAQLRSGGGVVRVRARIGSVRQMIRTLFWLLDELLSLYIWAVILAAVFSMLASFGVLDTRNRIVWTIGDFLYRLTEPALRPIRNFLPSFGNIDLSPLILLLLLQAARMVLSSVYESLVLGTLRPLL